MTTPDLAGEAEALIRALRGVAGARVRTSQGRIDSIHVTAHDDQAAIHMAAHVRSALLAGLAAPVTPTRIQVDVARPGSDPANGPSLELDAPMDPPADTGRLPSPRDRVRLLHDHVPPADHQPPVTNGGAPHETAEVREADDLQRRPVVHEAGLTSRPRLVSIDAARTGDGRVSCRVAIAYRTSVHHAEAVAVDLPGSAAQAAAQATVRALIDAGITGIELSGLREVEIAGRDYVLVALRRTEPCTRTRSGSAAIIGSPERSAAEATVAAAIATS